MKHLGIAMMSLMSLAGPCSKTDGSGDASSGGTTSAKAAPPNPMIVEHVKAHVAGCETVNVESGQAYGCKSGLRDAFEKAIREQKPADFATSFATIIGAKEDAKMSATAVALFAEEFDQLGEEGKKKNATPEAIDALIAVFKDNSNNRAVRIAKPLTTLATVGKGLDKIFAAADAHPHKNAKYEVYRSSLTFGRLDAFAKLKEGVAKDKEAAPAALDAIPRMYKPTEAEKAAVCPWAQGYLSDANLKTAAEAGAAMVWCRGPFIDALLAEAEKKVKDKQFKEPFAIVMREPCFQFAGALTPSAGDVAQCDKVYAFLEKTANDPTVEDTVRGTSLWNIYYQRRDEKTMKVMRKYENSPNKELSKRAKEAIKSLVESYKIKG